MFAQLPPLKDKAHKNIIISGQKISDIAKEARSNFALFYQYLSGYELQKHHWDLVDALVPYQNNKRLKYIAGPNTQVLMPRGAAKSTIGKYFLAWAIGNNPLIKILLISYNEDTAKGFSRFVKNTIEHNDKYHEVFPEIIPGEYWNELKWQINVKAACNVTPEVDYTLFASGVEGGIASKRSDIIYFDDIIKNRASIERPEIRAKRRENIYNAIFPTLHRNTGRIIDLGTRYHPQDEHATVFTEKQGYFVLRQRAILTDKDGNEYSYWEEEFPIKELQKIRSENPLSFAYQYQNEAIVTTSESFDTKWIQYKQMLPIEEYYNLAVGIDLASALGAKADYTVFMLCGSTYDGEYHIIDFIRGRWMGNTEKVEILLEFLAEHGILELDEDAYKEKIIKYNMCPDVICNIIPERVAYQNSFKGDFRKIAYEENDLFNLVDVGIPAPRSSKGQRFMGITGAFGANKVFINEDRNMNPLIGELTGFGYAEHDDLVDALVYALTFLFKRKPISVTWV